MDFLERVGEGYLTRKANAVPGQLENLVKKQFKDSTNTEKQAKQASTLPSSQKDKEIADLRKQLANYQLDKVNAKTEAQSDTRSVTSKSKAAKSNASSKASEERRSSHHPASVVGEDASETKPSKAASSGRRSEQKSTASDGYSAISPKRQNKSRMSSGPHEEADDASSGYAPSLPEPKEHKRKPSKHARDARIIVAESEERREPTGYDFTSRRGSDEEMGDLCVIEVIEDPPPRRKRSPRPQRVDHEYQPRLTRVRKFNVNDRKGVVEVKNDDRELPQYSLVRRLSR